MVTAATKVFWLDLRESEANRTRLLQYTEERKELHAKALGLIHRPKAPVNSLVSALMLYLQNLPASAPTEQGQIFWESSSFEAWMGMHWLIKKEWLNSYKFPAPLKGAVGIAKAKRDTEPMGDLLQALLHLCEKSHTLVHFSGYPGYIGGAKLFSAITVEIAHYGGVLNLLSRAYQIESHSGQNKKDWCRQQSAIVSQIKGLNPPGNTSFFFSQLLTDAIKRAEQNNQYKTTVFKNFVVALRAYVKHTDSKDCGLVSFNADQSWVMSTGKGAGTKKLFSTSLDARGV